MVRVIVRVRTRVREIREDATFCVTLIRRICTKREFKNYIDYISISVQQQTGVRPGLRLRQ